MNVYMLDNHDFLLNFKYSYNQYLFEHTGGKWLIPRTSKPLELWFESWLNLIYSKGEADELWFLVSNYCEYRALNIYSWYMRQAYQAVIELMLCDLYPAIDEKSTIIDARWRRYFIMFIFVFSIYITILFTCSYGVNIVCINGNFAELNAAIFANLDEVEEECGQLEDLITFFSCFIVFISWFFIFNIFGGAIILKHIQWILAVFSCLLVIGIVVPFGVFKKMGLACVQYIRGAGRFTLVSVESLLDCVSLLVIVLRFFLQNIRFIFIFVGFLEYYEYINHLIILTNETLLPWAMSNIYKWDSTGIGLYINYLFQIITQILLYLYYVGHLVIVYIAQLTIFLVLSFWVFFFFYTTYTISIFGNYFKVKRCS